MNANEKKLEEIDDALIKVRAMILQFGTIDERVAYGYGGPLDALYRYKKELVAERRKLVPGREEFLKGLQELLKKYDAAIKMDTCLSCEYPWASVKITIRGETILDMTIDYDKDDPIDLLDYINGGTKGDSDDDDEELNPIHNTDW